MPYTHNVPSATKLVSAIMYCGFAYYASEIFKPLMPEETVFGVFTWVNVGIALLCGWKILGKWTGTGMTDAISGGLTSTGLLIIWILFVQSLNEMIKLALERKSDGLMEAVVGMFAIALEFASYMLDLEFLAVLVVGSIIMGIIAELVAKKAMRVTQ